MQLTQREYFHWNSAKDETFAILINSICTNQNLSKKMSGFCRFSEPLSVNKRKRKHRQILRSYRRAEEAVEHELDDDTHCRCNP